MQCLPYRRGIGLLCSKVSCSRSHPLHNFRSWSQKDQPNKQTTRSVWSASWLRQNVWRKKPWAMSSFPVSRDTHPAARKYTFAWSCGPCIELLPRFSDVLCRCTVCRDIVSRRGHKHGSSGISMAGRSRSVKQWFVCFINLQVSVSDPCTRYLVHQTSSSCACRVFTWKGRCPIRASATNMLFQSSAVITSHPQDFAAPKQATFCCFDVCAFQHRLGAVFFPMLSGKMCPVKISTFVVAFVSCSPPGKQICRNFRWALGKWSLFSPKLKAGNTTTASSLTFALCAQDCHTREFWGNICQKLQQSPLCCEADYARALWVSFSGPRVRAVLAGHKRKWQSLPREDGARQQSKKFTMLCWIQNYFVHGYPRQIRRKSW